MSRRKRKYPYPVYWEHGPLVIRQVFFADGEYWRAYDRETQQLVKELIFLMPKRWVPEEDGIRWERCMASFIEKALAARAKIKKGGKRGPEKALAEFPALVEFLTVDKLPNGSARTPSALSLSMDDGVCKGCLKERDEGLILWASADTFQGVLEALEAQLTSEAPDWRPDRWAKGGKGKK